MLKKMAAAAATCALAVCLLPAFTAAVGGAEALADPESEFFVAEEVSFPVAPGVVPTGLTLTGNGTTEQMRMLEIDPKNPHIQLFAYSFHGEVSVQETVGRMIQEEESAGRRVAAGVNGDFFSTVGVPSGLQISDGEIVSSPSSIKTLLMVMADGSVRLEDSVSMTATLTADDDERAAINMINRTRVPSHFNRKANTRRSTK